MKKIIYLFALLGLASTSVLASTATFNFGLYADGNADGSTFTDGLGNSIGGTGESGYSLYGVTNNGISVTASGSSTIDDDNADGTIDTYQFAYMDSSWRSNSAGLGVCKDLVNNSQCGPSSDDNVTANETLKLAFNTTVSLDILGLVNGEHYIEDKHFSGKFEILVDSSQLYALDLKQFPDLSQLIVGKTFEFISLADPDNKSNSTEFYINSLTVSTVPVPAAAWLFGSALLGFFGFSRRKANT